MIGIRLDPVDTLFFRDGAPFTAGSAPQDGVDSLFPPHPPTVAGSLRAAIARCNGWNGRGRWPDHVSRVLGDGPDDFGAFSVAGPFLLRKRRSAAGATGSSDQALFPAPRHLLGDNDDGRWTPLFPAPRHLLGDNDDGRWTPRVFLRPGSPVTCDLGDAVRLPQAPPTTGEAAALKPGAGQWLTRAGMEAVLRGDLPLTTEVLSSGELWTEEPRVGLQRDRDTRTAKEGMLYSTRHVRLKRGVSLGARLAGIPEDWTLPFGRLMPLGGESRAAELSACDFDAAFPLPRESIVANRGVAVIALSPMDLDAAAIDTGRRVLSVPGGGDARIVSACLARPLRIGGWDSLSRRPLPLRSVPAPGSVLFCEMTEPTKFIEAIAEGDRPPQVGARQRFGFGAVALGVWPNESEVT